MIDLTLASAFTLYLGLTLLVILSIWLYSHSQSRKKKPLPTEQALFTCEYCHFVYLADNAKTLNRCPQCNLFNKENHYH